MEGKSTEHNGNHDIKIPVIDLPNTDIDEATGFALVDACAKYGFVFVKGKGLGFTADVLDNTFELVSFSDLSMYCDLESKSI